MINKEIIKIINDEPNCGIILEDKNGISRPSLLSYSLILKDINNKEIEEMFPEYINTKSLVSGLYNVLKEKKFNNLDELKTYLKMIQENVSFSYNEKKKSDLYFIVGDKNNMWSFFQ